MIEVDAGRWGWSIRSLEDGVVVASVWMSKERGCLYLSSLFTESESRGKGHATEMLNAAIQIAERYGRDLMLTACPFGYHNQPPSHEINTLIPFYEKRGFRVVSRYHKTAARMIKEIVMSETIRNVIAWNRKQLKKAEQELSNPKIPAERRHYDKGDVARFKSNIDDLEQVLANKVQ